MNNYFNQKSEPIVEGQTIVDVPSLIRSRESGDKIYYVKDNTKHWVTSPEVLKALGFDFGQEKEIDKTVMAQLHSGEPIRMENVNEYILPIETPSEPTLPDTQEESIEIPGQEDVDNSKQEGYFSIIIPCVLTGDSVTRILEFVDQLKKYFSGEVITVVRNTIDYKNYSPKFGNKVIECEALEEGVERARRVARGTAIVSDAI